MKVEILEEVKFKDLDVGDLFISKVDHLTQSKTIVFTKCAGTSEHDDDERFVYRITLKEDEK